MSYILLLSGIILLICVSSSKLLYKLGIPTLLIFLVFGMLMGSDGPGGIYFDNAELAGQISTLALVFIMFYGGFGVSWKAAKPILPQAGLLATVGVVLTAALVGVFAHFVLGFGFWQALLLGSVISSTDAASVFSILRSKKLNLKDGLASVLELESGSNDPMAYMLTIVCITMLTRTEQVSPVLYLIRQFLLGAGIGVVFSMFFSWLLRKVKLEIDGLYSIFVAAIALSGYALADVAGGNGFLAVYIVGIMLGNSRIPHRRSLVHFFDGISWLAQIILFFTLGLLVFPSQLPGVFWTGLLAALFLTFVARPLAVAAILSWFKTPWKHQLFISWAGLRGAASIVFAAYALIANIDVSNQIFNIVFFIALFSVLLQGAAMPRAARLLGIVDQTDTVSRTFSDYEYEDNAHLFEATVEKNSPIRDLSIMDSGIPEEILIVMIRRKGKAVVPKGSTVMREGDVLVFSGTDIEGFSKYLKGK